MNQFLKDFYVAYLSWLESGAEDRQPFRRKTGLCSNLFIRYATAATQNMHLEYSIYSEYLLSQSQMQDQFIAHGLDYHQPFTPDFHQYNKEYMSETAYLNAARIQWVKDRVAEFKE